MYFLIIFVFREVAGNVKKFCLFLSNDQSEQSTLEWKSRMIPEIPPDQLSTDSSAQSEPWILIGRIATFIPLQ